MLGRQQSGSVLCRSCGGINGVSAEVCFHCGARNPSMFGFGKTLRNLGADLGFGQAIIGLCVVAYGFSLALDPRGIGFDGLNALSPSIDASARMGAAGMIPVVGLGRWWTVLSAGWLHGSFIHILFNMYWVRILVPQMAELYGVSRTVIIYTLGSIAGFVLSSTAPYAILSAAPSLEGIIRVFPGAPAFTLGASAGLMGLWGGLICYGQRTGSSNLRTWAWRNAAYFLVFGFLMRGVDNWAHLGGLAGGWMAGRLLDPLMPERTNHMALAVACLAASALSIVVSLLVPVPAFR